MKYNTIPREPTRSMPSIIMLMGFPKLGKSAITANITTHFARGKSQVISLGDEDGYDNLAVNEIKFRKWGEFEKYLDALIVDRPFDFIIVDNTSVINEWMDKCATLEYMTSVAGKSFNLKAKENNPKAKGKGLSVDTLDDYFLPGDSKFKSVSTLPDGAGWYHIKKVAIRWFDKIKKSAKYVILISHPKIDRWTKDDSGKVVNSMYLDMPSSIARYYCKNVDAIASFYRKKDVGYLGFKHGSSDLDAGTRYSYLEGNEFKISEKIGDEVVCYWDLIYPEYQLEN